MKEEQSLTVAENKLQRNVTKHEVTEV